MKETNKLTICYKLNFKIITLSILILSSLIPAFIIISYCKPDQSDQPYTIEIKDGVKYIHNHAPIWNDTLKVALEFVQKIGELDTEDENYQFYRLYDIVRNANENLYILDAGNYRIQKFDKQGKFLATIGRKGLGPSEFQHPDGLEMDSEGNLYVGEGSRGYILVLTNNGKEIKRIKLFSYSFSYFRLTRTGNIIMPTPGRVRLVAENIAKDTRLISLYDKDSNLIKEFGEVKDYRNRDLTYYGNSIQLSFDKDGNIYTAFYAQNRIEKYSPDGDLIFRADRQLNYELAQDKEETITLSPELGGLKLTFPEFNHVSEYIGIDHKNRIWVQSYKKQKEEGDKPVDYYEFEIFDNGGVLLGKIPIPQNFDMMRIFDDRLYLIDSNEEMCVYEYKIVEK